nr:hypothetical protein [Akkermansiaceae bacterium]
MLRRAIDETRGLRGIGFTHVEDIIHLIRESDAGGRVHLPHGIRAIKKYATLLITAEPPVTLGEFTLEAGVSLPLPEVELLISATLHDTLPSEAEDDD